MKTIALGFLALAIAATSAMAGDEVVSKDYKQPVPTTPCFRDQEWQLDLFGSFMNVPYGRDNYYDDYYNHTNHYRDHDNVRDGGGGGLGVNYFFCKYFGIGVDGDFDSNFGGVANYTGKVILRLPIQAGGFCIAPYVFGGGGGETIFTEDDYGYYHTPGHSYYRDHATLGAWMVGGGLEWRITPRFGIFAEGRYTWTARYSGENGLNFDNDRARLGLRVAF